MNAGGFLIGLFRRLRSLILGREVEIVGHCRMCGRCCRDILLRNGARWITSRRQYRKLVAEAPDHARFRPVQHQEDGLLVFVCDRLGRDGRCTCHETRPALCRNYPSRSLYYRGGELLDDCGFAFRATTFRDVLSGRAGLRPKPFADVLERELEQKPHEEP